MAELDGPQPWAYRYSQQGLEGLRAYTISLVFNALYLIFWAVVQYGVGQLLAVLDLPGIDAWTLRVFQVVFAGVSLALVVSFIFQDLGGIALRIFANLRRDMSWAGYRHDRDEGENPGPDVGTATQKNYSESAHSVVPFLLAASCLALVIAGVFQWVTVHKILTRLARKDSEVT